MSDRPELEAIRDRLCGIESEGEMAAFSTAGLAMVCNYALAVESELAACQEAVQRANEEVGRLHRELVKALAVSSSEPAKEPR